MLKKIIILSFFITYLNAYSQSIPITEYSKNELSENVIDGPHIEWIKENKVRLKYFIYDRERNTAEILTRRRKVKDSLSIIKGINTDPGRYMVEKKIEPQSSCFKDVDKILMIGDIHGNMVKLLMILKNSGLIDDNGNWIWGEGHLVLIGDVFDKGERVTEILWFIKLLQYQAEQAGGRVHLLYGNHEVMNLQSDFRYASLKYYFLSQNPGISYSEIFNDDYELGRWLRSLKTITRINDILFVHGGISPEVLDLKLSIPGLNQLMREYLDKPEDNPGDSLYYLLLGEKGPLWYRGYLMKTDNVDLISDQKVEETLEFYNASRIVYGHTTDRKFRIGHDKRTICIDVSHVKQTDYGEQALLYKNGKFYKVLADGTTALIF